MGACGFKALVGPKLRSGMVFRNCEDIFGLHEEVSESRIRFSVQVSGSDFRV